MERRERERKRTCSLIKPASISNSESELVNKTKKNLEGQNNEFKLINLKDNRTDLIIESVFESSVLQSDPKLIEDLDNIIYATKNCRGRLI